MIGFNASMSLLTQELGSTTTGLQVLNTSKRICLFPQGLIKLWTSLSHAVTDGKYLHEFRKGMKNFMEDQSMGGYWAKYTLCCRSYHRNNTEVCPILSLFFMHQMAFQMSWPKTSSLTQCFSTPWLIPSFHQWTTLWWHCLELTHGKDCVFEGEDVILLYWYLIGNPPSPSATKELFFVSERQCRITTSGEAASEQSADLFRWYSQNHISISWDICCNHYLVIASGLIT